MLDDLFRTLLTGTLAACRCLWRRRHLAGVEGLLVILTRYGIQDRFPECRHSRSNAHALRSCQLGTLCGGLADQ